MLLDKLTDIQLINQVKEKQDSAAITELVERHTGIYVNVVSQYTYVPKIERDDLIEHRMYNIYKYALDFDPSKDVKFSTYIGQRIKWQCKSLLADNVPIEEISEDIAEEIKPVFAETEEMAELALECAENVSDKRFFKIFRMRHPKSGNKTSWKTIGKSLDLSHEGVRKIYNKNIGLVSKQIKQENSV